MQFEQLEIKDVILIKPNIFEDDRGHFFESFHSMKFYEASSNINSSDWPPNPSHFIQENVAFNDDKNIVRGLHFQKNNPQGKGVIVDLVLANGVSETPTTTNTTTTSTGSITDTVVIAAASSLVGSKFTEEDYLSRCKTIAETYSTVHGYTVPGKVEKLEETFNGKEETSEEKMPWDD